MNGSSPHVIHEQITVGVITEDFLPWYTSCAIHSLKGSKKCLLTGWEPAVMGHLLHYAGIKYEIVPLKSFKTGEYFPSNDSWDGHLGDIQVDYVDTGATTFINTELRDKFFDFTYPVFSSPSVFVSKKYSQQLESSFANIIKPFAMSTWVSLIITCISFLIIWNVLQSKNQNLALSSKKVWNFFSILFGQSDVDFGNNSTSTKFFLVLLSISALVFSSLYQNVLLIANLSEKQQVMFSSLSELATLIRKGKVQIITDQSDRAIMEMIHFSEHDDFVELRKSLLIANNITVVQDFDQLASWLKTGRYVFPAMLDEGLNLIAKYCDLTYFVYEGELERFSYVFQKNSTLLPLINEAIVKSRPMINYFQEFYTNKMQERAKSECDSSKTENKSFDITFYDISGCCVLFSVANAVAILGFIFELILRWCSRNTY